MNVDHEPVNLTLLRLNDTTSAQFGRRSADDNGQIVEHPFYVVACRCHLVDQQSVSGSIL